MNAATQWIAMTPAQRLDFVRENKPDRPDPDEPAFGEDDAQELVAERLIRATEVGELVEDVVGSVALLDWIARNVELPPALLPRFRLLDRKARGLAKETDETLQRLNGGDA